MNKAWLFTGDGYICDLRTAGVLVRNDMILVQRDRDGRILLTFGELYAILLLNKHFMFNDSIADDK